MPPELLALLRKESAETSAPWRLATQAAESLRQSGCSQFDVCVYPADRHRLFLDEVYSNQEAFAIHLATPHFKDSTPQPVSGSGPRPSRSGA